MPISINPEHAATRGFRTSGLLKLESMDRLLDRLVAPFGEVKVELEFGKHGQRMFLQGNVTGEAVLQCQRCLQKMRQEINHQFRLGLISCEAEIEGLLPGEEPLLIEDDSEDLRLIEVIEDELELLLPMVVKHPAEICQTGIEPSTETEQVVIKTSKKNPFEVLMDLKKR